MVITKASPHSINYFLISLLFIPRFFSDAAYQTGTVLILIFWIVPFVLISEMASDNWTTKIKLSEFPKSSSTILLICLITILATFYWRKQIYSDDINSYHNLRRSLYLISPLILISWYPFIKIESKRIFLLYFSIITFGLFACLGIPIILEVLFIGDFLNDLTASISGLTLSFLLDNQVHIDFNVIKINERSIEVGGGCSSTPQILISLFASMALYICSKIKSVKKIVFYLMAAIVIAFIGNSIRISILAYLVSIDKDSMFDFWHHGAGSLIFSFSIMLISCSLYYYIWAKENPIKD